MSELAPNRTPPAEISATGLFDRTRGALLRRWRHLAARVSPSAAVRPDLPAEDLDRLRRQVDACLEWRGGGASARARAAGLGRAYFDLNDEGKLRFFQMLAREYGIDRPELAAAIERFEAAADPMELEAGLRAIREATVAPRIRLLRQFNGLIDGVKFLVDLRASLMHLARVDPTLQPLDHELRELLASWFDIGFLELRRITWEAPAALLEKLIAYEAVHEIRSWEDLKDRLDSDRRCYAFFHPAMPNEPLIFVEVALVNGMAGSVQDLLDRHAPAGDPENADTAIFYSISNAQRGLAGVSFGDFLIKRVVTDLSHDLPNLKVFATLSPIPGFLAWLRKAVQEGDPILGKVDPDLVGRTDKAEPEEPPGAALLTLLADPEWPTRPELPAGLENTLMSLAAHYLLVVRRGDQAQDRVAHFHLSNGARVEQLNWLADCSPNGLRQSAGIMVNYRYNRREIETNHQRYREEGKIAASGAVRGRLP
jgi:malonyl-CoA decarboxylase